MGPGCFDWNFGNLTFKNRGQLGDPFTTYHRRWDVPSPALTPGAPCSSYRLQDLDKEDDDILAAFSTLDGNQNHKVYNTSPEN